jgi:type II secretory pathway pseudopilin PulG
MTYTLRFAQRRQGVTLIELLIVILVMLMITAVTLPAISPALEGRKIREGARILEVFLNSARNRAVAENKVVGVLVEPDENEPSQCISLSLVEQPDPWSGDFQDSRIAILGNGGFGVWSQLPSDDGMTAGIISTTDPIFSQSDVGWIGNIAPGDVFTLGADDTIQYRLYAGEPFVDCNGNGQWDASIPIPMSNPPATGPEPFNDVDGSGSYTPPNQNIIDPNTGMFTAWPAITWGTQSAFITYTFADPILAAGAMHPMGREFNLVSGAYTAPIWLSFKHYDSNAKIFFYDADPASSTYGTWQSGSRPQTAIARSIAGATIKRFSFTFNRRPVPLSSSKINLPDGVAIDLGANFVPPGTTNIVGVPGSGSDMIQPFSASNPTLGNYATFRPNPICDHETNPNFSNSNVNDFNRPLIITFDPSGVLGMVYSWDERHFMNDTTGPSPAPPITSAVPNFSDYQGRFATSPIYLLVGKRELVDGDPDIVARIANGQAPLKPAFNVQDPNSLWVSVSPRTGLITSAENVAPDLTIAPLGTTPTQLQLYFNAQTYQARSIAREAFDMGGM